MRDEGRGENLDKGAKIPRREADFISPVFPLFSPPFSRPSSLSPHPSSLSPQRSSAATPRFASSSARSLPGLPSWPRTHIHSTSCFWTSSSSFFQRSIFLTRFLSAVRQPRLFHS